MAIAIEGMPHPLGASAEVPESPGRAIVRIGLTFLGSLIVVYAIMTAPSYWAKARFWVAHAKTGNTREVYVDTTSPAESFSGAVGAALRQPTFATPITATADQATSTEIAALQLSDNHLVVPKLRVNAPIVWDSSSDEKIMLANLQQGVAHYGFTARPNEESGNVFITGHSSYYWWDSGKYKTIFATLDQLKTGDQAFIQYQSKIYVYEVTGSDVVKPSEVNVTDPSSTPILSLMTCVPVGTSLNRLVVTFKLARAYAAEGAAATVTTPAESLPPASGVPSQLVPRQRDVIELIPGRR